MKISILIAIVFLFLVFLAFLATEAARNASAPPCSHDWKWGTYFIQEKGDEDKDENPRIVMRTRRIEHCSKCGLLRVAP